MVHRLLKDIEKNLEKIKKRDLDSYKHYSDRLWVVNENMHDELKRKR
jgi:hypothetical protein